MNTFNNREIALAIWLIVGIVFVLSQKPIREGFQGVWKTFCQRLILVPLGLMVCYIIFVVFGLHKIGLWDMCLLKNTVLWSISAATVSFFRIPQITEDEHYFRNTIKDNFKFIALIEFVVAFYTFPLWAELLIVPVVTALVAIQTYAEMKEEYAPVEKLLNGLLSLFGGSLITYAVYKLFTDFGTFTQPETLTDFSLPIVLSLLFLPFLFALALYVNYENTFLRLDSRIKDIALRRYAKRATLFGFHVRTSLLKRWLRNIGNRTPTNQQELKASIVRVKDLAAREKHPIAVPLAQGWSPHYAREFLTNEGLMPGDYHQGPYDDAEWFASSPYFEIGKSILSDDIAYYLEGDEHIAKRLKLLANFNDPETASETRQRFVEIVGQLFYKALHWEMPADLQASIIAEAPYSCMVTGKAIEFVRESWPSAHGYSLRFIIQNATDQ